MIHALDAGPEIDRSIAGPPGRRAQCMNPETGFRRPPEFSRPSTDLTEKTD
jgi:hypothetical protein